MKTPRWQKQVYSVWQDWGFRRITVCAVGNLDREKPANHWWWQERSRPLIVRDAREVSKMLGVAPEVRLAFVSFQSAKAC
jgi:hypothetical protein